MNYVERVRRSVEETNFRTWIENLTGKITVSAGVATYPGDSADQETLFRVANQALLRAKRAGNNRVCLASEDPADVEAVFHLTLGGDAPLRAAALLARRAKTQTT